MTRTVERLREAAFELFEQQGYDATTVEAISTRLGAGGLCPCCDEPVTLDELLNT